MVAKTDNLLSFKLPLPANYLGESFLQAKIRTQPSLIQGGISVCDLRHAIYWHLNNVGFIYPRSGYVN